MSHRTAPCVALALLALLLAPARADIETLHSGASIRFAVTNAPAALAAGDFTVFFWYRPSTLAAGQGGLLQVPGLVTLRIDQANGVSASVTKGGVPPTTTVVTVDQHLVPGEWALLAVSLSTTDGRFTVFAQDESSDLKMNQVTIPALAGSVAGPPTGEMAIGASPVGLSAATGLYGMVAVRNHRINASDFAAVWNSRRHWAAFDADNTAVGGHMAGESGCVWMTNHAMTTMPLDAGTGQFLFDRAAVVGQPVGIGNVHVFSRTGLWQGELAVVRPVTAATGFVYRSHCDAPYSGFFVPDLPQSNTPGDVVPRRSPVARQLVSGPTGTLFVMTSADSRAVGWHDGSVFAPSNYAHGFIEKNLSKISGILFRPAIMSSGGGKWFGFDCQVGSPPQSPEGTLVSISGTQDPCSDFSRFWTGSENGFGRGAGEGLFMNPGSFHSMRCRPEPGSLIAANAPLHVVAHVLRFPGSSSLTWKPDKATFQPDAGSQGAPSQVSLDTTAWSRVLGPGDQMVTSVELRLDGDHTSEVHVGDAGFVAAGTGAGGISVVTDVQLDQGLTRVTFSHPFFATPSTGSQLLFGPWSFDRIEYTWPGLAASDPQTWRGLRLEAGTDGSGAVVFAYSAWRPDVDGFVFGTSGWGGHGYQFQLDLAFPGSIEAWAAESGAAVWLQCTARFQSSPDTMRLLTQRIRNGLPGVEMVWAAEAQHITTYPANGQPDAWDQYILDHAAENGAVGIVSVEHPRLGDFRQQLADGMRKDGAHFSQRGNRVQADVWTELLARAALPTCRADLNGDAALNLADFGTFRTYFTLGDPRADFNDDGVLNLADFGAFQTAFALGC
jgi:hypothetical protein